MDNSPSKGIEIEVYGLCRITSLVDDVVPSVKVSSEKWEGKPLSTFQKDLGYILFSSPRGICFSFV